MRICSLCTLAVACASTSDPPTVRDPRSPRPQACHPTSPARPALSPAEAACGARFEQSRAALTQARPRRLS